MHDDALSPARIAATRDLIRPYVRRTPILKANLADFGRGNAEVAFKLEFLQRSGSFKFRGAVSNLTQRNVPPAGVVAASGGNHGVAVAYAAKLLGVKATIFVPRIATPAKIEAIRRHGADLVIGGDLYENALQASSAFAQTSGALTIHAFNQIETLLGQGTIGAEIEEDTGGLDTFLVAVGGGGLIGGIAAWLRGRVKLAAVEPERAPTLHDALKAGRPVDAEAGGVAADSLAPRRVGELAFSLASDYVAQSLLVSDDEIRAAQRALWETLRVAVEPGGAAAFAPLLSGAYAPAPGERIAVLLCGANTDAVRFPMPA